jgi:hypothetical protein
MDTGENTRLKQQIAALRSNNRPAILETIKELRSDGDVSVLPELFNLLLTQEDEEVHRGITSLLNDLKEKEAADVLATAISNPDFKLIQTSLVAACWQNGLSYTRHLPIFVDVFVNGTYSAAIEAFTVIEEAVGELEVKDRDKLLRSLKSRIHKVDEKKKDLYAEMVRTIERYGIQPP